MRRGRLYFLYIWVSVWTFIAVGNVHHSFELLESKNSEREGRAIDKDQIGSMEKKKQEGYF